MKKKADKKKDFDALRDVLGKSPHVFMTGYEKLTVPQDFELRKAVRAAGASYRVVKNNLVEKAGGEAGADLVKGLRGMTPWLHYGTLWAGQGAHKYAKVNACFTFKAAWLKGVVSKAIGNCLAFTRRLWPSLF
jgi:large subunit ribosomal protein L10